MPENRLPAFYDFEASSLAGVPIEVGWAYAGDAGAIVSASCLIKPPPEWCIDDGWDEAAEELHGISRATLTKEGRTPFEVCRTMNMAVAGRELYSDSTFDPHWLRQLFDAAGQEPAFMVRRMLAPLFIAQEHQRLGGTAEGLAKLERELVGKTGMWDGRMDAVAASYFIRVRFRPDVENSQHFTTFMNLPSMKRRLAEMARGAIGQANINAKELQSIEFPVPPIELQNEFATRVTEIRGMQAEQASSRARLDELFNSMLGGAFNEALLDH